MARHLPWPLALEGAHTISGGDEVACSAPKGHSLLPREVFHGVLLQKDSNGFPEGHGSLGTGLSWKTNYKPDLSHVKPGVLL